MFTYTLSITPKLATPARLRLNAFLERQTALWNAALEERIHAWRKALIAYGQCKPLTAIRRPNIDFRHLDDAAIFPEHG